MELIGCYRISVYVPADALKSFVAKVSPQIPSFLGNYDHVCWWSDQGSEQYRHKHGEKIECNPAHRVEIIVPQNDEQLQKFIEDVIILNHPWEEPVITFSTQKIVG